jgi:predicted nucleic acid-binding protein
MRIVIDASMIFSLLLGKNAEMRDTFFDPTNIFYTPNYIIGFALFFEPRYETA